MAQQLLQSIEKLRNLLATTDNMDPAEQERLLSILHSMENLLGDGGKVAVDEHESLIEQLRDSLWAVEKSHPTFTVLVGRVLDNLNRMGI